MNWESNPVLDNHLYQREVWAKRSRKTFYQTDPEAHLLASFILEALADFTASTSGNPGLCKPMRAGIPRGWSCRLSARNSLWSGVPKSRI